MSEKMLNTGMELGRIAAMTALTDPDDNGEAALMAFVQTLHHAVETESHEDASDLILAAIMSFADTCHGVVEMVESGEDAKEDEGDEEIDPKEILRALFGDVMGDLDQLTSLN